MKPLQYPTAGVFCILYKEQICFVSHIIVKL